MLRKRGPRCCAWAMFKWSAFRHPCVCRRAAARKRHSLCASALRSDAAAAVAVGVLARWLLLPLYGRFAWWRRAAAAAGWLRPLCRAADDHHGKRLRVRVLRAWREVLWFEQLMRRARQARHRTLGMHVCRISACDAQLGRSPDGSVA
eukprot:6194135-Pleurochrysis_carterae.AAC.2